MRITLPQLTPLAAALVAALFAPATMAAPLVGATSSAEAPFGNPGTPSLFSDPGYASSNTYVGDNLNSASSSAFANSAGAYAVRSQAEGKGQSGGSASFKTDITNNSGAAQRYFLTLKIYGGSIGTYLNYLAPSLEAGESLVSTYSAKVTMGTNTVFSSAATLTRNDGGISVTRSGTVLTGADNPATDVSDGQYSWSQDYYSIDLGVVADGATVALESLLEGSAFSNVGTYDFDSADAYGNSNCNPELATRSVQSDSVVELPAECTRAKGGAQEFYGDPIDVDTDAFVVTSRAVDVPEPGALPLVGLGLGAAVWAGRRRRRQPG